MGDVQEDVWIRAKEGDEFILKTRLENRYSNTLDEVFLRSTSENPDAIKIKASISLCDAVRDENRNKFIRDKRRQQIRDSNQQLKLLEEQIRAAYVMKTLEAQLYEKKAYDSVDKFNCFMGTETVKNNQIDKHAEQQAFRKKQAEYRDELLEQIAETNAMRIMKSQSRLAEERRILDENLKKLHEDQERQAREDFEKKMFEKRQMEEFKRAREEYARAQTQASEEEEEKILEMIRQRELANKRALQEKRERQEQRDQQIQELGRQMHEMAVEKLRREEAINDLLCDERHAKDIDKARQQLERAHFQKIESRHAFEKEFKEKERRRQEQERVDRIFYEQEMRDLAERDRLQSLSEEKKKNEQAEHQRQIKETLKHKQVAKVAEMHGIVTEMERVIHRDELLQQEVDNERDRMLREHGPAIEKYLVPSVRRIYLSLKKEQN